MNRRLSCLTIIVFGERLPWACCFGQHSQLILLKGSIVARFEETRVNTFDYLVIEALLGVSSWMTLCLNLINFLQKPIMDRLGEYDSPDKVSKELFLLSLGKWCNNIQLKIHWILSRQNWHCNYVGPLESMVVVVDLTKMKPVSFLRV